MSFLADADDVLVVEEALALIEACEGDRSVSETSTSDSSSTAPEDKTKIAKPKKRRIKTFASSSTRQLQRKKAEMQSLREQIGVLQTQLSWIMRSRYIAASDEGAGNGKDDVLTNNAVQSEWYKRAVEAFMKRKQAENTNVKLKAVLANQEKVCESLRSVLGKRSLLDDMNTVLRNTMPMYRTLAIHDCSREVMRQLELRVDKLYSDSDRVFSWDQPCLVASTMNVNANTQFGKVIEIETVTPVACSIQEASALLWKDMKTIHEIPDKHYRYLRGSKPDSLEKNFVMTIRGQQSDIVLDGSHFSRKFEEQGRVVLAKADSIILQTDGLQFRSPSWTIISASESGPHQCVVRSYLRLYGEVHPSTSARKEDIESTRALVLSGLSKMMFGCVQTTQSELIQQTLVV